ncbi:hypothetical protein Hanom_Chr07g00639411 [Helianthus anomalus]
MFIARKKDKEGRKFGFLSLRNVKDTRATEKVLNGLKMGDWWDGDVQGKKDGKDGIALPDLEKTSKYDVGSNFRVGSNKGWVRERVSSKDILKKGGNSDGVEIKEKEVEVHSETWFSSLDIWAGKSVQYERVAWLKFHGVPLHLAENKVFDDMAGLFGKVIHKYQLSLMDKDLSVNYVGFLVDQGERISDMVTLRWKNKKN